MNPRLFLLVLVTATFMAAWDGDQAAMEAALAQRNRAKQERMAVAQLEPAANPVLACATESAPVVVQTLEKQEIEVPLPARIAAGHYQAVSPSGLTQEVVVTSDDSTSDAVREFYTVDDEQGHRWFLVRVDPSLRK